MTDMTYKLNGGVAQAFSSPLAPADAQLDLIFSQDFSHDFLLEMWIGVNADTNLPVDFAHQNRIAPPPDIS